MHFFNVGTFLITVSSVDSVIAIIAPHMIVARTSNYIVRA